MDWSTQPAASLILHSRRLASAAVATLSVVLALGAGLSAVNAQEPAASTNADAPEDSAQWFADMLARNGDLMPEVEVAAPDGFFQAKVAAQLVQPVELVNGAYLVTFRFAEEEESLGDCYIFPERMDLAGSLISFSDNIFSYVTQTYAATIESKAVLSVDSGQIDGAPYLGVAWLYRMAVEGEQQPAAGQAKHWMALKEDRAIYCQTSFLGYDQTFFDLFEGFVGSLRFKSSQGPTPYFEEVSVMRVNGQKLGVSWVRYFVDADGDLERRESQSALVPVDAQTLQSQDSLILGFSNADGEPISRIHVLAQNGQVVTNLRLAPENDATWSVTGTYRGKELKSNLGPGAPRFKYGQRLDFVEFMKTAKPGDVLASRDWTPSKDPTAWDEIQLTYKAPHAEGYSVTFDASSGKMEGVFDSDMNLERAVMDLGGASMSIEGIFERGDIWHPKTLAAKTEAASAEAPSSDAATPDEKGTSPDPGW